MCFDAGEDVLPIFAGNKAQTFSLVVRDADLLLVQSHVGAQIKLLALLHDWGRGGKGELHLIKAVLLFGFTGDFFDQNQQRRRDEAGNEDGDLHGAHLGKGKVVVQQHRKGAQSDQQDGNQNAHDGTSPF